MRSQWKCFKRGSVRKTCRIRSIPPPEEKLKNVAAPRSHFIISLHSKTDLPFVSQEIIFFDQLQFLKHARPLHFLSWALISLSDSQDGDPQKLRHKLLLGSLWMSYLWCICTLKRCSGEIVPPPSASSHRARAATSTSRNESTGPVRECYLPHPSPFKKRKTWRPWGLSINQEQSQWPFCLC